MIMNGSQCNGEFRGNGRKFAVVIPAFNEASTIHALVHQVNRHAIAVVVDDGSSDNTADLARSAGAFVVAHEVNRGYDAALETGIRVACANGFFFVITMDADGQHDPNVLCRFIDAFEAGADLVIGRRDSTQRWAESLFGFVGGALWGIDDPLCGMKGYSTKRLKHIERFNTYESAGTELAILLCKRGVNVNQIPITTRSRKDPSRFGVGLIPNIRICRALWRAFFLNS
jgi:glycosyltransferase involved in cell wall biosynthesis